MPAAANRRTTTGKTETAPDPGGFFAAGAGAGANAEGGRKQLSFQGGLAEPESAVPLFTSIRLRSRSARK